MQIHWAMALDAENAGADRRAGRLAAKRVVAAALGLTTLDRIEIDSADERAPRAFVRGLSGSQPVGLALSIAHRDGRAVAAAARGAHVGVDVERELPLPREQTRYFLGRSERPPAGIATIVCWALKEAAWKALGLTRSEPLTALELIWRGTELVAVRHDGAEHPVHPVLRRPWRGYLSALVVLPEAP